MIRKLQVKFVVINMAMVTVMLCVIFGLVYHFTRANLEAESISVMKTIAADPFQLGHPNETSSYWKLPYFTVQLGGKGELLSTSGGYYDLSDKEFLKELIARAMGSRETTGILKEYDLRFCRVATPIGTVLVFADLAGENRTLEQLVQTSVVIGIFSFLLFLGISMFLSRWAVKPVAAAWRQQKQFVADASHELKTPLTVILTNAELLQSEDYDETARHQFSRNILLMSEQMRQLVEKLLELARAETGQTAQQMQPVNFSKLVLDEAISFEGVFVEKGLRLESRAEPDITVRGSEQALRQVVGILLDNAQKYSAPEGETVLQLSSVGQGKCRLTVANTGAAIPAGELQKIFQRFYRRDAARSRDGSVGLGLSIAESIVTRHKGKIWAESREGINTFTVELRKSI